VGWQESWSEMSWTWSTRPETEILGTLNTLKVVVQQLLGGHPSKFLSYAAHVLRPPVGCVFTDNIVSFHIELVNILNFPF